VWQSCAVLAVAVEAVCPAQDGQPLGVVAQLQRALHIKLYQLGEGGRETGATRRGGGWGGVGVGGGWGEEGVEGEGEVFISTGVAEFVALCGAVIAT